MAVDTQFHLKVYPTKGHFQFYKERKYIDVSIKSKYNQNKLNADSFSKRTSIFFSLCFLLFFSMEALRSRLFEQENVEEE